MKPVKQTKFHSESENGNCMAASLASLLELPLNQVPQFEENQERWKQLLFDWLESMGLTIRTQDNAPEGFAIATGMCERGFHHAVVVHDGQWAHDPHPTNAFLTNIRKFWVIEPKQPQSENH